MKKFVVLLKDKGYAINVSVLIEGQCNSFFLFRGIILHL